MPSIQPVPTETQRVARAAFPRGSLCMQLRDVLEVVAAEPAFAALFARRGQPAEASWRLVLVMVLQFVEGLSDRQAADAIHSRIDWKYALGLELADPGIHAALLTRFKQELTSNSAEQRFLDTVLTAYRLRNPLNTTRSRRPDRRRLEAESRAVNRLEHIADTLRQALRAVSVAAPGWLDPRMPLDWHIRYGPLARAALPPHGRVARRIFVQVVGADGQYLLDTLARFDAPPELVELEVIQHLRHVWSTEFAVRKGHPVLCRVPRSNGAGGDTVGPIPGVARRPKADRLRWDLRRSHPATANSTSAPRIRSTCLGAGAHTNTLVSR